MRRRQQIAAVGLAVAVVTGLSGAAAVEAAGAAPAAPVGKSDRSTAPDPPKSGKPGPPAEGDNRIDTAVLARQFGVPQAKLERALDDVKRVVSGLPESAEDSWSQPAVVAVVARDLGVSPSRAAGLLERLPWFGEAVSGSKGGGESRAVNQPVPAAVVAELAKSLHVSNARPGRRYSGCLRCRHTRAT